jgi:hypothetical protein
LAAESDPLKVSAISRDKLHLRFVSVRLYDSGRNYQAALIGTPNMLDGDITERPSVIESGCPMWESVEARSPLFSAAPWDGECHCWPR